MLAINDVRFSAYQRRSAIALAVAIACSGAAHAQSAPGASDSSALEPIQEVVVSGSRISTAGFDAPTPTTVLGDVELRQAGRTDIQATLTDLPQFRATQNAQSTNTVTSSGQSPADLRGLGSARTLVLVNNRRYISSNDLQTVPYSLVKRIDVVTGGASAAYGSDAVAGVVNIILDDDKEGGEIGVQRGRSTHGDAEKTLVEAAFGSKLFDGRAHFLVGADYLKDDGIIPGTRRPRIGETAFFPGADGRLYPTANLHEALRTEGGLINTGVLTGNTFDPDGSLRPFQYGVRRPGSPSFMIGGEGYNVDQYRSVMAPIERSNALARFSVDVNDSTRAWAEVIFNKVEDERVYFPDLATTQIQLRYDNPFLNLTPAQRAQVQAAGETTFTMGRALTDVSLASFAYDRTAWQATVGIDGDLADGKYRYNVFYGKGQQEQDLNLSNLVLTQPFRNAVDAVIGPNGTPVCRIALTDPSTACRPLNLFGSGRADQAAIDYATADWHAVEDNWLDTAGVIISGEPFQLYDQPVSFAAGLEYRKVSYRSRYDENSLANRFATINGVNIGEVGNNVKEAFVEIATPILADLPFVQALNFNGAARISDYSTSGDIWSWKLGTTWEVVNDFKFRATRSRDIRAPNLTEMFSAPATFFTTVLDLGTGLTGPITQFTGGNPGLDPEIADTTTVGAVYSPSFLSGFQVSLDYYDIQIEDVISTLTAQQIVNSCYQQGNQSACGQINRGPNGLISTINATYINIAEYTNKGWDFEASYKSSFGPGQLTTRLLANYVDSLAVDNGLVTVEGAGYLGNQANFLVPKWRGSLTFTYESELLGGDLRARYLDGGAYAPANVLANQGDNQIASRTYIDLGLRGYIPVGDDTRVTIYSSIQNVFDKEPALAAINSPYFDIVGRYFTLGVRANF